MDSRVRRKVIADLVARLKTDLDNLITDIPEHWDEIEMQWLLVRMAERLTSSRTDLGLRRKGFTSGR